MEIVSVAIASSQEMNGARSTLEALIVVALRGVAVQGTAPVSVEIGPGE